MNFTWTVFASRYAISSRTANGGPQAVEVETFIDRPFEEYVKQHQAYSERCIPKDQAPGIVHGLTNGYRGSDDIRTCTALVLDCDNGGDSDPSSLFADPLLSGPYMYQARLSPNGLKWHLVIPFADPESWAKLQPAQITARRRVMIDHLAHTHGIDLDRSTAGAAALLHPYSRRVPTDPVPRTVFNRG